MSRIGSTPGPDPYRPVQGPQGPGRAGPASGDARVGAATPPTGAGPAAPISPGDYARIRDQIREGVARGWTREQVLHDLVARAARDRFGPGADAQMTASIGRAFETDPYLKGLFAELFQRSAAP